MWNVATLGNSILPQSNTERLTDPDRNLLAADVYDSVEDERVFLFSYKFLQLDAVRSSHVLQLDTAELSRARLRAAVYSELAFTAVTDLTDGTVNELFTVRDVTLREQRQLDCRQVILQT